MSNTVTRKPTGAVLYQGPSLIDGSPIVAILTGLDAKSANPKTGNMAQVWILRSDVSPVEAARTGADVSICGDCPHRGTSDGVNNFGRSCYVILVNAPRSVFAAYSKGRYPVADSLEAIAELGAGRMVRLGAYGDPAAVPAEVWQALTSRASDWTGYTHQWRTATGLRGLVMASVDNPAEATQAAAEGWRYFLVSTVGQSLPGLKTITCPASAEAGKRTVCAACRLCNGARPDDKRANITILAHGSMALHVIKRQAA